MTATPNPLHAVPDDDLLEEIELRMESANTGLDPAELDRWLDENFSMEQLALALARRVLADSEAAR